MAAADQLPGAQFKHRPPPNPPPHRAPKPAPKPPPKPAPKPPTLNHSQQGIYDLMMKTLTAWGLGTLAKDLKNLIMKGDTSPDTLSLALSQTDAYKKRFSGNELRRKAGLPELSPAEYIGVEEQYTNILKSYGLPSGFYDKHEDFTKMIGGDLSPDELRARAQIAHDQYMAAPEYVKNLWSQYFGTKGDALAAIIDPDTATAVISDRAAQVGIGGAAVKNGLGINQVRAQQLQQSGVTLEGAQKAYQQIAQSMPTDQAIASRFGTTFDQSQEENDLLLGDSQAGLKRQTLYNSEESLFHSGAGLDANSLGVVQNY